MSQARCKRASLLIGCGSAALALGLTLGSAPASAQGIQADGTVVFGTAAISNPGPNETNIALDTPTTVIDWVPREDASGDALTFLPTGSTATFASSQLPTFAVLNRILPSTNGNVAEINGAVVARVQSVAGAPVPGGFVAFYSPTGLLIGSTATFDVGSLLLTTLDTTPASFDLFASQGFGLQLQGAQGSTARIQIAQGAQITATPENAFFAVVAADVEMRGTARINGSHAYVAGEVVNLSFNNGLFSIDVPVGTAAAGEVVTLDGTVGGPSSTGNAGDNHIIYAVARASADPISMLFRGNLGFDAAQAAGVVNGEIILSANYNVFGRFAGGGFVNDGVNAEFRSTDPLTNVRADIDIGDAAVSSSLLAIGSHRVTASATGGNSAFSGNLLLVGRQNAQLIASGGNSLTVAGDVLVDSRDYGVNSSFVQVLDTLNAQGGSALVEATTDGTITLSGQARVLADAFAGSDNAANIVGSARGGTAAISGNGGTIDITGATVIGASGVGAQLFGATSGAESRGGNAELRARAGGVVQVRSTLDIDAGATGAVGDLSAPSTLSNAFGGNARIALLDGGGTITVDGAARLFAAAFGGSANAAGVGSVGDGGEATVSVLASGLITLGGALDLDATGVGGANGGGTGGTGLGGRASVTTFGGGTIRVAGDFAAFALGFGGDGLTGGNGFGGIAGANAIAGTIQLDSAATAETTGTGGDANLGDGGNGGIGRGGNAFLQADGNANQSATLTIGGSAGLTANGFGGRGGNSDGLTIAAGRGGDGFGGDFTTPNQADPNFGGGAYLLAGGDYGTLSVTGTSFVNAQGAGGQGGSARGTFVAGDGGNGFGGLAQSGLALLGGPGTVGGGSATFSGDLIVIAAGFGGDGGFAVNSESTSAVGGNGTGGAALLTLRAGDVSATTIDLSALGFGGSGETGGIGLGGEAAVFGSLGGTLVTSSLAIRASGLGGFSSIGIGGAGTGGVAEMEIDATTITINGDLFIEADGSGGSSFGGVGGAGLGGEAYIGQVGPVVPGTLTVTGHTTLFANGRGGSSDSGFAAGNGQGGHAWIRSASGSTKTFGSLQMGAIGTGGFAISHEGGDGIGGLVELISTGTGSAITVLRNVPSGFASESPAGAAMLSADGVGETTAGGDGIGGIGRGGTINVNAAQAGRINLPVDILLDDARAADTLIISARGIGGNSVVDGGTGGAGLGGNFTKLVDGGTLVSGAATPSVSAQGGSTDPMINGTGGDATGGTYTIRVINNGSLTIETVGTDVGAGARGGDGSGTGNGGNATAGAVLFEVINSVASLPGIFTLSNSAFGGSGQRGGNAGGGSTTVTAQNASINLVNGLGGPGTLALGGDMVGGAGITAGGDALATTVNVTLTGSTLAGGRLDLSHFAVGGSAFGANGTGGNATGAAVLLSAANATLNLSGQFNVAASAIGGTGGSNGVGGAGTGGTASVILVDTALTGTAAGPEDPANIAILADGDGGFGGTAGSGSGGTASLNATRSTIAADQLRVSALGQSFGGASLPGGAATGGQASAVLSGASTLAATTITVDSSATTSLGGTAQGGTARFEVSPGSAATVNATSLRLAADASGADPAAVANTAGQFFAVVGGGNVNLASLDATATGDRLRTDAVASQLVADGGNLNVSGALSAATFGDLLVRYGAGGTIGSAAAAGTTTAVTLDAGGTIRVLGDGGTAGGLGGQTIDVLAGRSILLDGNLAAADGPITLTANGGGGQALAAPPVSVITMAPGTRINAGTGTVTVRLLDGAGDLQRVNGAITLASITAGLIDVRNLGTSAGSNIDVLAGGVLTASGSGRAIDLASLNGEVINLAGDAGLVLTGGGNYAIFAATPTGSQIGSFANYVRRYNVANAAAYDALNPGGNFAAFRIVPVLTVTADNITRFYGNANPALTASFVGFLPGDGIADLAGAPQLTTLAGGTSNVGQFAINTALGTLLSEQGYQFTFSPGILTVAPRPITVTATSLTRIYGDANPALTFTVGGLGLVNGDQITGAVTTTASVTTGAGNIAITQGSLAASANYALTFVPGQLTISPRPLTLSADSLAKLLGLPDPPLTFALTGGNLVNGDQLSGAPSRDPGERPGTFAIRQGTAGAGPNYAITFVNGTLTIDAPPTPPELNNPTTLLPPLVIGTTPPPVLGDDDARFGIDFPERPDAPLISEDPLLDDPVASGGDPSLYGGGAAVPPAGDK